jgi:hypothetical protein
MTALGRFQRVWLVDFEYSVSDGDTPVPICMVAIELRSGELRRWWFTDLRELVAAPIDIGCEDLFVAFFASAEMGCFLALEWPAPANVLDLYVEFRNSTNGLTLPAGNGLLGALAYYDLASMAGAQKDEMRALALRGGPWSEAERSALLDYCQRDVEALRLLLDHMVAGLDVERALLRGQYMVAVAEIERTGIPLNVPLLRLVTDRWGDIRAEVVRALQVQYGAFEGESFRASKFRQYLAAEGIRWPEDAGGRLLLNDEIVEEQALIHGQIAPFRVGRQLLTQLKAVSLTVGADGRNRALLSPFRSKTGRNQPSSKRFVFGAPSWLRRIVSPESGRALAYIDWEQQEFGIAAALSEDSAMIAAYESGDAYLAFAQAAGAVPPRASKQSHGAQRELFKQCALGVIYGMTPHGLAARIDQPLEAARQLLRLHQNAFPTFWEWSDAAVYTARINGRMVTTFGWQLIVTDETNDRTLRNYPMQANAAEMLRLAILLARERGIVICAPVHDALLIEAVAEEIDDAVDIAREAMADASSTVLGGMRLRSEAEIIRGPGPFPAKDPANIWSLVERALGGQVVRHSANP